MSQLCDHFHVVCPSPFSPGILDGLVFPLTTRSFNMSPRRDSRPLQEFNSTTRQKRGSGKPITSYIRTIFPLHVDTRGWLNTNTNRFTCLTALLTPSRIGQGAEAESRQEACDEKCLHEDALKLGTYGIPEQLVESYAKR